MHRLRDLELWDAIAKLEGRAAFRDGVRGQAAKKEREATAPPNPLLWGAWLQRMKGAHRTPVQSVPDETTGVKIAQAHFARDVKRKEETVPPEDEDRAG